MIVGTQIDGLGGRSYKARKLRERMGETRLRLALSVLLGASAILGERGACLLGDGGGDDPSGVLGVSRAGELLAEVRAKNLGRNAQLLGELRSGVRLCCHFLHLLSCGWLMSFTERLYHTWTPQDWGPTVVYIDFTKAKWPVELASEAVGTQIVGHAARGFMAAKPPLRKTRAERVSRRRLFVDDAVVGVVGEVLDGDAVRSAVWVRERVRSLGVVLRDQQHRCFGRRVRSVTELDVPDGADDIESGDRANQLAWHVVSFQRCDELRPMMYPAASASRTRTSIVVPFVSMKRGRIVVTRPLASSRYFARFFANALRAFVATAAGMTHDVFFASGARVCSLRRYARSTFGDTPRSFASSAGVNVFAAMFFTSFRRVVFDVHNVHDTGYL